MRVCCMQVNWKNCTLVIVCSKIALSKYILFFSILFYHLTLLDTGQIYYTFYSYNILHEQAGYCRSSSENGWIHESFSIIWWKQLFLFIDWYIKLCSVNNLLYHVIRQIGAAIRYIYQPRQHTLSLLIFITCIEL